MAITTSIGTLVIALLIGYIVHATAKRIARVEDDFQEMSLLKKRAEDADIAKSQVISSLQTMRVCVTVSLGGQRLVLFSLFRGTKNGTLLIQCCFCMQFLATVSHEIRTPMNGVLGEVLMYLNCTIIFIVN
jgi:hypothetical protein